MTFGIQVFLILLLSFIAVYAFSNSFVFPLLVSTLSNVFLVEPTYISVFLAAFLIVVGSLKIIMRREPKIDFFIFLVAIFLTPSVLTTATINWAQILGLELDMANELPWGIILLFTTTTVSGYIVLRFSASHNSSALIAADRGYNRQEVGTVYSAQHTWGFIIAGGAATMGLIIFLVLKAIESTLGSGLGGMSTSILSLGIVCSLGLIMTVYVVIISGRSPDALSKRQEVKEAAKNGSANGGLQTEALPHISTQGLSASQEKVLFKTRGIVTLSSRELREADYFVTEGNVVIEAEETIKIPLSHIQNLKLSEGGVFLLRSTVLLTFLDEKNKKHNISLEMDTVAYSNFITALEGKYGKNQA